MNREDVYTAFNTERNFQEKGKKNPLSHIVEPFPLGSALTAIRVLMTEVESDWYNEKAPYPKSMDKLRKIGAVVTQMGEEYGMPERRDVKQEASDFVDEASEKFEEITDNIESVANSLNEKMKEFSQVIGKEVLSEETRNWLRDNLNLKKK